MDHAATSVARRLSVYRPRLSTHNDSILLERNVVVRATVVCLPKSTVKELRVPNVHAPLVRVVVPHVRGQQRARATRVVLGGVVAPRRVTHELNVRPRGAAVVEVHNRGAVRQRPCCHQGEDLHAERAPERQDRVVAQPTEYQIEQGRLGRVQPRNALIAPRVLFARCWVWGVDGR